MDEAASPATADQASGLKNRLYAAKVSALYLQAPTSNIAVIAIAILFFVVLQTRLEPTLVGLWTLLMIVVASFRLLLWFLQRRPNAKRSSRFWLLSYTAASTVVGVSWGLIQLAVDDFSDPIVIASQLMLLFGVTSSALAVLSIYMPAFIGYVMPQLAMVTLAVLRHGSPELALLSPALAAYCFVLLLYARFVNKQFNRSVELTGQNDDLVSRLSEENEQREEIIQTRTATLKATNLALEREVADRELAEAALRSQQAKLQNMAHHDVLTGLPNRLLLTDRLNQALAKAQRNPTQLAVLFVDLDHFKQINDSLGHSAGDTLLKLVAERLQQSVREGDTVARLGGDEFILLLEPVKNEASIINFAQKILDAFAAPFDTDAQSFSVTVSIGISMYPRDGTTPEKLLRNADSAMYRAKANGREDYTFYSADMTDAARNRLAIERELKTALIAEEFQLHYQPQISMNDGRIVGAEALLRWQHPRRGMLMPDKFIPVAEESTIINRLGAWVLREGCRQLREWEDAGLEDFELSLNLSGRDISNNPLLDHVDKALDESGCSPDKLELEITEKFLVQQPEHSRGILRALRDRGISIAIDDFGTGYSSLSYLKQYPINKLKIDQSFVRDIESDADDQAIVKAIIALGHSLELVVVAEGVENEVQADFLRGENCQLAQGYLYARPMPAQEFEVFLEQHQRLPRA